jgi:DeoR family fructose operon transcriptional repressor
MIPSQRHDEILRILDECEKVEIADLYTRLQVTEITIRRDLIHLEEKGLLERIRGGAAKIKRLNIENIFDKKNHLMQEEKRAIGMAAPQFIENNDTVFINGGTTTTQVAMHLKNLALKIVTNNPILTGVDLGTETSLIILGGEFRAESHSIVGDQAGDMINQIYANKCIIGVDGISLKYGLTNSCFVESGVNKKMIEHTHGKVIVVADHTKIGKVGPFINGPIEVMDILITTKGFPEEYFEQLISKGIKIIVANDSTVRPDAAGDALNDGDAPREDAALI